MNDDLTFRRATESDLPEVLRLYAQPDMDDGKVLDLDAARALLARFARYPDYSLWIGEIEGRAVASFALLIMDNLAHLGTPSGIVEDVVVDPVFQSRGIGVRMMDFARARCAEKGCYKMALTSNQKRLRAHAFYDRLGFARHGFSFVIDPAEVAQ